MKTTTRFILLFFIFVVIASYYVIDQMHKSIAPGYWRALEESVNDLAQVLSSQVQVHSNNNINTKALSQTMQIALQRKFSARIFELEKTNVTIRVYVTDKKGIVLYDSQGEHTGKDFSLWNDVHLTLQGRYGARASRLVKDDPMSSSIYIGAPIFYGKEIVGVLTAVKPKRSVNLFIKTTTKRFTWIGIISAVLLFSFTVFIFIYISLPLAKLTSWVKRLSSGKTIPLPKLGKSEIQTLGKTIFAMHQELNGRKHVEQVVQSLTHELKSPLTSLLSSLEILKQEDLDEGNKEKFHNRAIKEIKRMQHVVDEIATLARLEAMDFLEEQEKVDMLGLANAVCQDLKFMAEQKQIIFLTSCLKEKIWVMGNQWLLRQMLLHLLGNAIEFADAHSHIQIEFSLSLSKESFLEMSICNQTQAIPPYALPRLFEQFFSLPRPNSQEKSSGLGLSICKEIVHLHQGSIGIRNSAKRKVEAKVTLPAL